MKILTLLNYVLWIIPALLLVAIILIAVSIKGVNPFRAGKDGKGRPAWVRAIAIALVAAILYGACFALLQKSESRASASAVISLLYPKATKGLNPNDTRYNSSQILSDEVLGAAIAAGNFPNVSVDELRRCLEVKPLKTVSVLDADHIYMSTEYRLSFSDGSSVGNLYPSQVVDAVARAYYDWFVRTYTRNTVVLNADFSALDNMEYMDMADFFEAKATTLIEYANLMHYENTSFRSSTTGEAFTSIAEKAVNFRDVQIERFRAFILANGIAKEKPKYITRLNYENKMSNIGYQKSILAHDILLDAIDNYERDMATVSLVPSRDYQNQYYMSRTKVGVDYFADEADSSMQNAATLQKDMESNVYTMEQMINHDSGYPTAQLTQLLNELKDDFESLSRLMIQTLSDYDRETYNGFLKVQMQDSGGSIFSAKNLLKILLMMAIMFVLVFVLAVLAPFCGFVLFSSGSYEVSRKKATGKKGKKRKAKRVVTEYYDDDDDDEEV